MQWVTPKLVAQIGFGECGPLELRVVQDRALQACSAQHRPFKVYLSPEGHAGQVRPFEVHPTQVHLHEWLGIKMDQHLSRLLVPDDDPSPSR